MKFTPDLEIGVGNIDSQHKELFDRIAAVVALGAKSMTKEETDKTINMLGEYIVKHFRDEELLMARHNYPELEKHKVLHAQYIDGFHKLKAEYYANGPSALFTLQLNQSIIEWIVKHIKTADKAFGKFMQK